jgi:hypothetical protein
MAKKVEPIEKEFFALRPIVNRKKSLFSEHNAIELLESKGLIETQAAINEIKKWPTEKVEQFCADVCDFVDQQRSAWKDERSLISPFNCVAGSSMRGDSGCSEPSCRSAKLNFLARYAAMYAEQVFLPLPLENPGFGGSKENLRQSLIQTVMSLLELRPLVEKAIVKPVTRVMHYCEHHAALALGQYQHGTEAVDALATRHLREFKFSYEKLSDEPRIVAVRAQGPDDYLEHGTISHLYLKPPEWIPSSIKLGRTYGLQRKSPVHAELVKRAFSQIAADAIFHQQFGPKFNATYLTDLAGEAELLKLLSEDDGLAMRTAKTFAQLTHEIPLLTDLPIRTILRIREDNPESFEAYRLAVNRIVREQVQQGHSATEEQARDIYHDILSPALADLRVEAKRQHSKWVRKSVTTAALAIGVVSLGATGVLQAAQVMALLGGATLKGLVDQLADAGTEPVTSSNLYFLIRLENEITKRQRDAS